MGDVMKRLASLAAVTLIALQASPAHADTTIVPGYSVPDDEAPAAARYLADRAIAGGHAVRIAGDLVPWAMDIHDWQRMAACESGGDWRIVDKSRTFYGGLQLAIPGADRLPVEEQIELARGKLDREGPRAWPFCSRKIGWN